MSPPSARRCWPSWRPGLMPSRPPGGMPGPAARSVADVRGPDSRRPLDADHPDVVRSRRRFVTRQWPDALRIDVTERVAVAVVDIGGRVRGMDAAGVVFRDYPRAPRGLPLVRTTGRTGGEALREAALVVSAL